jgi:hypothetical protein
MGWVRATAAAAVASILTPIDATVSVFASPPETFNPPAYIVGYTRLVNYDGATFGVDRVDLPVMAAAGIGELDRVDALLAQAKDALDLDPSAGGAVQSLYTKTQDQWRVIVVGGSELLAAELVLDIRM